MNKDRTSKTPAKPPILIKQIGHVQTFRYPETGEEFSTTITTKDEIQNSDDPLKVVLVVKWHSNSPSMKEITALRKLCPELKGISAGDFFYMVKRTLPWELGEFYKWKALELIEAGAKYGLDLGIEELSKEPNPRYRSK
ncbi:hypothetical protein IH992_21715 [Candidatus Poribacteria bacterium]|nr:hypothetical protein [Candidatus Poribacteria bacterium]